MLAAYPQYATRSARFSRYTTLLAELRAASSSAEDDDERLQWELEGMKFWIAQEFSNSIACSAGKRLIYGVSRGSYSTAVLSECAVQSAELQEHVWGCACSTAQRRLYSELLCLPYIALPRSIALHS